jgi:hypothetical protein
VRKLRNLAEQEPRALALKLLLALLGAGYLVLFVWSGLALALGVFTIYILFLLNIIRKVLD